MAEGSIEVYESEDRRFPPPTDFVAGALLTDPVDVRRGGRRSGGVLGPPRPASCSSGGSISTPCSSGTCPSPGWFLGGTLNVSENCLDRHVAAGRATRSRSTGRASRATPAPSPTPPARRRGALRQRAARSRAAQGRPHRHLHADDPELPVAMLACTRIGVAHSVIFGGFSPDAITDRCEDAQARLVITADAGYRRGDASAAEAQRRRRARGGRPQPWRTWWWSTAAAPTRR